MVGHLPPGECFVSIGQPTRRRYNPRSFQFHPGYGQTIKIGDVAARLTHHLFPLPIPTKTSRSTTRAIFNFCHIQTPLSCAFAQYLARNGGRILVRHPTCPPGKKTKTAILNWSGAPRNGMFRTIALPCVSQGIASGGGQSGNRIAYRRIFSIARHFKFVQQSILAPSTHKTQCNWGQIRVAKASAHDQP